MSNADTPRHVFALMDEQDDPAVRELLAECGEGVHIRPPFHLKYGNRVSIGAGKR